MQLTFMANQSLLSMTAISLVLTSLLLAIPRGAQSIGVSYGMLGNNLPSHAEVVSMYKSNNIVAMRLYGPNPAAFQALRGSNIQLILDVPSRDLQSLASDPSAASSWVENNVSAYWPDVSFKYIAVGNEVIQSPYDHAQYVLPAMRNVRSALSAVGLQNQIQVSTSVSTAVLGSSYPPSNGAFSSAAQPYMSSIAQFLASNGAPLLVNVYPYFSYVSNTKDIDINYALFTFQGTVPDGQYNYHNLFDATVDATYAALEKVGGSNVPIVVSETGWPSAGGPAASISNAQTYNQNLIRHVGGGTPRRPGRGIETYIFAMFNENQKDAGVEQNWGLFYPYNKQPVYPITFN